MITAAALTFPRLQATVTSLSRQCDAPAADSRYLQRRNPGHDLQLPYQSRRDAGQVNI
jgi:hypothetical protein